MVGTLKADDMETDDAKSGGVDETTTTIEKNEEEEEEQEEQEEEKVDHKVQLRKLSRAYEVAKGARDSSRQEKAAESIAKGDADDFMREQHGWMLRILLREAFLASRREGVEANANV